MQSSDLIFPTYDSAHTPRAQNLPMCEANLFAAQLLLPDEEFLEYARRGWDVHAIAAALETDVNLAALKGDILAARGCPLRPQPHKARFLSA